MIMKELGPEGVLCCFDQDPDARANVWEDTRLKFYPHNFRNIQSYLRIDGIEKVDGILADLGVSSHQFDTAERGFSFRFESDLDMRMDQVGTLKASDVLNNYRPEDLQQMFSRYGEIRNAKTLAQAICETRTFRPFEKISDLVDLCDKVKRGQRNRYLAQVFQALRIEVNDEMGALEDFLKEATSLLKPGGRLVVISYHSLEDRMVKQFVKTGNIDGEVDKDFYGNIYRPYRLISKKAILPEDQEIEENPRARSAKMRIAERLDSK